MTDDVILNDVDPSPEVIHRWAYDENLLLIDQDEDLILGNAEYVPMLLQLAREPDCPKNDYCLSIVYYCSQIYLLARDRQQCDAIFKCVDSDIDTSPVTSKWAAAFRRAYHQLITPRALSHADAVSLAKWLLVGDYCHRSFIETGRIVDGFYEFKCYTESYNGYLYINLGTGAWQQSIYHSPLQTIDASPADEPEPRVR
ncbi:hypothetical protein [uncultured Gimesia sp.]|uniref:hypothetical protein n=1 Tax=uncultured Gimesia sp. TaxID=1678688 RepID=UPI00261653BB|nr:hypothetical protein [uncultured Gimesia sp.]